MFATLVRGSLVCRCEIGGYNSDSRGSMLVVPAALETHRQKVSPIGRVLHRGEAARQKVKVGLDDAIVEFDTIARISCCSGI